MSVIFRLCHLAVPVAVVAGVILISGGTAAASPERGPVSAAPGVPGDQCSKGHGRVVRDPRNPRNQHCQGGQFNGRPVR